MNTRDFSLTSRPWWLSHAVTTPRGIVVARANAVSAARRRPTQADVDGGIACNMYDSSPECHGALVVMMVDLTDGDLLDLGLIPGILEFPNVVDGSRPRTNRADAPVSMEQAQRAIALLQSEGHCDDLEPLDNTPWQKGDNYPE